MSFIDNLVKAIDVWGPVPKLYGWYHIICLVLTAALTAFLILKFKNSDDKTFRKIILITWIVMVFFEAYKQVVTSFDSDNGTWKYLWYYFPLPVLLVAALRAALRSPFKGGQGARCVCIVHNVVCLFWRTCGHALPRRRFSGLYRHQSSDDGAPRLTGNYGHFRGGARAQKVQQKILLKRIGGILRYSRYRYRL